MLCTFVPNKSIGRLLDTLKKIYSYCVSKNPSCKYSQKFMDHVKQTTAGALKITSKIVIHKTAETIDDLIGSKIANKITKMSRTVSQNTSGTDLK